MINTPPKDAPRATCPQCGAVYVDWEDWSGPAHSERDCVRHLLGRVSELENEASAFRADLVREASYKHWGDGERAAFEKMLKWWDKRPALVDTFKGVIEERDQLRTVGHVCSANGKARSWPSVLCSQCKR